MARFIKFNPESDLFLTLISQGYHHEVALLSLMACRARRSHCPVTKLSAGECYLGDLASMGLTEKQYRTAKKRLTDFGLASFRGSSKGTIGKLETTDIYDINAVGKGEQKDDRQDEQKGDQQDEQGASRGASNKNKNGKNKKKNEEGSEQNAPPAPKHKGLDLSNLPELVSEQSARDFIDHRSTIKKPMSQKALALCMNAAAKAPDFGLTPEQVIEEAITRGWMKPEAEWVQNRLRSEGRLPSGNVTSFPSQSRREYIENNNVPRNKDFPAEYLNPRRGA